MTYRVVVAAGFAPSDAVGGGLILYTLLGHLPPADIAVVAASPAVEELRARGASIVGCELAQVRPVVRRLPASAQRVINALAAIQSYRRTSEFTASSSTVVAVPWRGHLGPEIFIGAVLAARRRKAKLVVYEMDEWLPASDLRGGGQVDGLLERLFHGLALRQAAHVWTVSSEMASRLRQRFGVTATVVPSAVDLSEVPATGEFRPPRRPAAMVFTGAVYRAQADALARVAAVVRSRPDLVELELYTDVPDEGLRAWDIPLGGNVRRCDPVRHSEIPRLLSRADLLLLPFAFDDGQHAVVSTSFPTKVADYLASGRPILVHAPPYSTVARASRRDGWGLVVDEPEPAAVEEAIVALLDDAELCATISRNALEVAARDHDLAERRRQVTGMLFSSP